MKRRITRQLQLGSVFIGGDAPASVQSMTNTRTDDAAATLKQIKELAAVGCDVIRCAVPDMPAAQALREIVAQSPIPVIADIHFDYKLALAAIDAGVNGLRLNPGNIGGREKVEAVVAAARIKNIPIRIGVNAGSLPKDLLEKYGHPTAEALVEATGGKGDYAELLGLESDTNCQVRSNAFHRVLDQTDMKMVAQQSANWDQTEGQSKAETILQQYPDITAIVCGNDTMACGAAAAVAAANLDHDVYIIGVDGSNDMRDNIKDGKALATALQQIDKITRNAVTQANDYLTNGTTGLEEKQLVDCVVITKDNADKLDNFVFAE